jgi:hypothetical protein
VQIWQITLVLVAAHPGQAILPQGLHGWHRFTYQTQGDDLVGIVRLARVEHSVIDLIQVGTDPGIGLTALHQAYGTHIGHTLDFQADPGRFEDKAQDIPGQASAIGMGMPLPGLTGNMDVIRLGRIGPHWQAGHQGNQ